MRYWGPNASPRDICVCGEPIIQPGPHKSRKRYRWCVKCRTSGKRKETVWYSKSFEERAELVGQLRRTE